MKSSSSPAAAGIPRRGNAMLILVVFLVILAGILVCELELAGEWLGSSVLLVGAAGAAFVAGRVSRRVTVIEPAVACNHCGFCKSYGH